MVHSEAQGPRSLRRADAESYTITQAAKAALGGSQIRKISSTLKRKHHTKQTGPRRRAKKGKESYTKRQSRKEQEQKENPLNIRQSQPSQKQSQVSRSKDAPNPMKTNKKSNFTWVGFGDWHSQRSRTKPESMKTPKPIESHAPNQTPQKNKPQKPPKQMHNPGWKHLHRHRRFHGCQFTLSSVCVRVQVFQEHHATHLHSSSRLERSSPQPVRPQYPP
jgi:hypothetical protein